MPVPLAIAAPAVVAGLAYLDAKYSLSHDVILFRRLSKAMKLMNEDELTGRHNIFFKLEERALSSSTANRPFVIFEGKTWTYRQAYYNALRYGTWLKQKFNVRPTEIVAMAWTNNEAFIWLWYGISMIGAKPCFINHNLTGVSLVHCVKTGTAKVLLVDPEVQANITQEVRKELTDSNVSIYVLDEQVRQTEVERTPPLREPDSARRGQQSRDLGVLIFTSGTTGLPKAAWVSWQKINRAAYFTSLQLELTPQDRFATVMPMYHSAASILGCHTCLWVGCAFVLGRKFSSRTYWPFIRETRATVIQYVGETCRYMLSAPPSPFDKKNNVRLAYGNGLRPDIWNQLKERFDIPAVLEFYAATEAPGALYNYSRGDFTAGAVGRSGLIMRTLMGSQSAIVQVDHETETPLRDPKTNFCVKVNRHKTEPGEMIVRLNELDIKEGYQGYYNNEKATDSKVLRDVFAKGDAWYRTGDMIRPNADGLMYFHDRIGDTFRWKSENVSTNEVSEAMGRYPAVSEANVYGVEVPKHDGRAGCAAVVLKDGSKIDTALLEGLAKHITQALPKYAVPIFVRFTNKLEATGTNKHMKHVLRAEGVDPDKVAKTGDKIYWLQGDQYVPFEHGDWDTINNGGVKL